MMHQRLRVDDPDFSEVGLYIVSFGRGSGSERTINMHSVTETDLYSYDELNAMIDTTYRLWIEEIAGRQAKARRASGGPTPTGF